MVKVRILRRYTWSLSAVLSLAGLIIIAAAQWLIPEKGTWVRDLVTEIGIAVASGGIVGFVYENLIRSDLLDEVRSTLADTLILMLAALG